MKYYCDNCGTEIAVPKAWERRGEGPPFFNDYCPVCGEEGRIGELFFIVPEFESVSQWEERTGRKYPCSAPVYVLPKEETANIWELREYQDEDEDAPYHLIVATEAGAPPGDWRPE